MNIIPFRSGHLDLIEVQGAQAWVDVGDIDPAGPAFTAVDDGRVIACGGVVEIWRGRLAAWMLISECGPRLFIGVHAAVRSFLAAQDAPRIEATVDEEFPESGHRWMRALGFALETPEPMKNYRPNGGSSYLYARTT